MLELNYKSKNYGFRITPNYLILMSNFMKISKIIVQVNWCVLCRTHSHTGNMVISFLLLSPRLWKPTGAEKVADACVELSQPCGSRHAPPRVCFLLTQEQWKFLSLRNSIHYFRWKVPRLYPFVLLWRRFWQQKWLLRVNLQARICRQQNPPTLSCARIRAIAVRGWRLNAWTTKRPRHEAHLNNMQQSLSNLAVNKLRFHCCFFANHANSHKCDAYTKKQSFLMLKRVEYIVIWFVFHIMKYIILFSIRGSQHLG